MPDAGEILGSEVELIREPTHLRALEEGWRALAVARGNAFVSPEWFWAWNRHYGRDSEPLVPVVRDGEGALLGLLPLVSDSGRSRTVRFAGSALGDHFHPAARAETEDAVVAAAGPALTSGSAGVGAIVAQNVDADSAWWRELSIASGFGQTPLVDRVVSPLPSVRLAGRSWEDYLSSRSRNLRSQLGRKRRTLERAHHVSVRWIGDDDDLAAEMRTLFYLHDLRWDSRGMASSLTSGRARAFHTDFADAARRRGWLRLCFLELDSKPVAGWYGWRVGDRFAYYQAGFDPAWSAHSVGLLLFADTIRAAVEEGAHEYDMLLGAEAFKARFADSSRSVTNVVLAPRLRPSRLLAAMEMRARRTARKLPSSLREPTKRSARSLLSQLPLARRR